MVRFFFEDALVEAASVNGTGTRLMILYFFRPELNSILKLSCLTHNGLIPLCPNNI